MADVDHEVQLVVPAQAEYVDVIRTVVGRQAHRLGFSFDGIEDVCLAVDEATVLLLALTGPAKRIEVGTTVIESSIEVSVALSTQTPVSWPPGSLEHDIRWQVLEALADDVRVTEGARPAIVVRQRAR